MNTVKIVVEKHDDGYVAYPLGIEGAVVGEGDTFDEALADVKSALVVYSETFGAGALEAAGRGESTPSAPPTTRRPYPVKNRQ